MFLRFSFVELRLRMSSSRTRGASILKWHFNEQIDFRSTFNSWLWKENNSNNLVTKSPAGFLNSMQRNGNYVKFSPIHGVCSKVWWSDLCCVNWVGKWVLSHQYTSHRQNQSYTIYLNRDGERSFESEERSQESLWSSQLLKRQYGGGVDIEDNDPNPPNISDDGDNDLDLNSHSACSSGLSLSIRGIFSSRKWPSLRKMDC